MKRFNLTVLIMLAIGLTGCDALSELTKFDMSFSENVTIKATLPINIPFDLPTPPIQTNSASVFESNNTNKDLIDKIQLKSIELSVISPDGEDFSILKSIEIYITADGETSELIAWKENVLAEKTITLDVSDANLQRFIIKDQFGLNVKAVTDEINTRDYVITIKPTLRVDAKILGF